MYLGRNDAIDSVIGIRLIPKIVSLHELDDWSGSGSTVVLSSGTY